MKRFIYLIIFDLVVGFAGGMPSLFADPQTIQFRIKGNQVPFVQDDELHLMVSKSCYPEKNGNKCKALSSLKTVSYKKVGPSLKGGKNPGLVICTELLRAEGAIGIDAKGNENPFCSFSDGSYIDCGTLTYYGLQNDQRI